VHYFNYKLIRANETLNTFILSGFNRSVTEGHNNRWPYYSQYYSGPGSAAVE